MKALYERWTAISLPKRILGGMILGAVLGMMIPQAVGLSILGNLFVNALKGIAPLLVFFLVISSLCQAKQSHGGIIRTVICLYLFNTLLGAVIAVGFGQVTALRASVAGAEGGCQAEIGTASAMAAAALTHILGGTAQQCADAYAIALGNLLGLVCDPVAGLVEVPCVKRNVIGAVNAVSAANMAVAGITSRIPVDEVIDAMGEVGDALPASLRETGLGGLAATPTGRQAAERIARAEH